MDWVHCNNCFLLPDSERSFFLTSCGHIYCSDCKEQCAQGKCKLCGNQCSTITLSSSMKPDVQIYFTDPDEILKKKLKEVHQVSEFQKNHRARLMAHQRKQLKKFKSVKEDFRKLLKNLKDLDSERKRLHQENDVLKKYIGMQKVVSPTNLSKIAHRLEKGHSKSSHDNTSPHSNLDSVLSKFVDTFNNSKSHPGMPQRVCVISPPRDGKLGIIPGTPSPSTALKKLNLSANYSNESQHIKSSAHFETPNSTPGSLISKYSFVSPMSNGMMSLDGYCSPTAQQLKYKRDARKKLVVHPFSPDD